MNQYSILQGHGPYILVIAILLLVVVVTLLLRRSRGQSSLDSRYVEALNALLEGDDATALQELRQTVQIDRTNVDAYLRLGNLLRKRGMVDRALRIHLDLDVGTFFRRKLTEKERSRIREAVADDYLAARKPEKALQVLEELLNKDRQNQRIRSKVVAIHERQSNWDRAFELFREGFKVRGEKAPEKLAQYRAFCGNSLLTGGDTARAKEVFRESLKLDSNCSEALYRLGLLAYEGEELDQAIMYWESFHRAAPEKAYLTFERFETALFETGNLNRVEEVYQAILAKNPREERTLLALSTFHARRGETDKAIEFGRKAVDYHPASVAARHRFALLLSEVREPEEAVKELSKFLKDHTPPAIPLVCSNCNYQAQDPFWRCPQCLRWNTAFAQTAASSPDSSS